MGRGRERGRVLVVVLAVLVLAIGAAIYKNESRKTAALEAVQRAAAAAKQAELQQQQARADAERAALVKAQDEAKTKDALAQAFKAVDDLYVRWQDASTVAGTTSRIALSTPVANMQSIKRDAENLAVPPCLAAGKSEMVKGMQLTIEGYLEFMANTEKQGDMKLYLKFEAAKPHFVNFSADRQLCPKP